MYRTYLATLRCCSQFAARLNGPSSHRLINEVGVIPHYLPPTHTPPTIVVSCHTLTTLPPLLHNSRLVISQENRKKKKEKKKYRKKVTGLSGVCSSRGRDIRPARIINSRPPASHVFIPNFVYRTPLPPHARLTMVWRGTNVYTYISCTG